MNYLVRPGLFILSLFSSFLLQAQADCTSYPEVTLIGDTVCFTSFNAYITVKNTQVGKSYQAYWGEKAVGASAVGTVDGGQLTLTLPLNSGFTVGPHIISLRSAAAVCPANTFAGDTAMVVINSASTDHLKVKGDTICDNSSSASITIQNTKPGEIFRIFQGSVALGAPLKSNGGDIIIPVAREKLTGGANAFYVQLTVPGCGTVFLNESASVVVNSMPDPINYTASSISPICEGNSSVITIPATSVNEIYNIYLGSTLVAEAKGTGSLLSIPIPASALVLGRNTFTIHVTVPAPKGCGPLFLTLGVVIEVNASPTIPFQLEKDTVVAYEVDPFAEVIILSSAQGVVFGGIETPLLIGTVLVQNTGRDTLKLSIGNGSNQLTVGTHSIVVKAMVGGCNLHEYKDTVIVIIKPSVLSGIESATISSKLKVWPNPFSSEFHVAVTKPLKSGRLRITDALGTTLYEQEVHSEEVTIASQWPSGMYYLEISGEDYKEKVKLVK